EAPSSEVPCEVCHRHGKVKRKDRLTLCPTCGGSGWRKAKRKEQKYDSYTRWSVTTRESSRVPSMSSKQLDAALERLHNDAASRAGVVRSESKLERSRNRRDATGS